MNTAVILAARKEKDSEIPYPLRPYTEGECLVERTLRILREIGYTRIFLVVGYRAELFEKFNADDVTVLINKEYEFTSSMGSLALVKDLVDEDFLLLEGDTFYDIEETENYIYLCGSTTNGFNSNVELPLLVKLTKRGVEVSMIGQRCTSVVGVKA